MASSKSLVSHLQKLQDAASHESIQTVAKYFLFQRKSSDMICSALIQELQNSCQNSNPRVSLYISVINEILIADESSPSKWKRNAELRNVIGEKVILPFLKTPDYWNFLLSIQVKADNTTEKTSFLDNMIALRQKWQTLKSFSNSSMLLQIDSILEDMSNSSNEQENNDTIETKEEEETKPMQIEEPSKPALISHDSNLTLTSKTETVSIQKNDSESKNPNVQALSGKNGSTIDTEIEKDESASGISSSNNVTDIPKIESVIPINDSKSQDNENQKPQEKLENNEQKQEVADSIPEFEFPNKDQPPLIKVKASDFLEHCKSIATMQIAREIGNDTAARLWNALQTIPKEVEDYARTKLEEEKNNEGIESKIDGVNEEDEKTDLFFTEKTHPLSDEVLDLNIEEKLNEVKQFRDVVLRQRRARQKCIDLLIQSKCQFGSMDAAQAFEDFGDMIRQVKKRKLMLSDAMELEGLDFEEDGGDELDETTDGVASNNGAAGMGVAADGEKDILEPLTWFTSKK